MDFSAVGSLFSDRLLGVDRQEESSLSRFYNDTLREKMHIEKGCPWAREVYIRGYTKV